MRIKHFFYFFLLCPFSFVSCANLKQGKKDVYQNSIFYKRPSYDQSLFSPPSFPIFSSLTVKESSPLDVKLPSLNKNLYLKSQSEFHYILAETWSLEGDFKRSIEELKLALVYDSKSEHLRLRLAVEYFKEGLWFPGIEEIEKVLLHNPISLEARFLLASVYTSLRFYKKAHKEYQVLEKQNPKNHKVPLTMASLFLEQGNYDRAEIELKKGLDLARGLDRQEFHFQLARLYFFQYQIKKNTANPQRPSSSQVLIYKKRGKETINKSLALNPKHTPSLLLKAELFEEEGKLKQSLQTLLRFERQFGPHIETSEKLAQMYIKQKENEKALKYFEQLEDLNPYELNYKLKAALIQVETKKYSQALDRFHFILRQEESDRVRFYLGIVYGKLFQLEKAFSHFSKIPKISSYYISSLIEKAYLYQISGNQNKAKEIVKAAFLKNKNSPPELSLFYASSLEKEGKMKEALQILQKASSRFPKNVNLIFFTAVIYDKIGKTNQALNSMKKVLLLDDTHLNAMNYVAYIYAERNTNLILAESLALRVLKQAPDDGHYLDTMGRVLFRKGKIKEAIIYLEKAFKKEPNESVIAEHLAEVYLKYKLIKKSYLMYKKAFQLEKDEDRRKELAAKIQSIEALKRIPVQRAEASLLIKK